MIMIDLLGIIFTMI